jgi:3-oxoadipate enol-lactonase
VDVVLIHGLPSAPSAFESWLPHIAALGRPRIVSLPGYEGEPPVWPPSLDAKVQAVLRVTEGVEDAVVLGFSAGFYVATHAVLAGMPASRLLGIGPSRGPSVDERPAFRQFADELERGANLEAVMRARMVAPAAPEALRDAAASWLDAVPTDVLAAELRAYVDWPDLAPALERVRIPVRLLVGEEDAACPPVRVVPLADHATDGRAEVLPGSGHACFLEQPEATAAWLRRSLGDAA